MFSVLFLTFEPTSLGAVILLLFVFLFFFKLEPQTFFEY